VEQILKTYLPQIAVQDTHYPARRDPTTRAISAAARATPNDDWYDFSFNGEAPIATVPLAEINFGPLRSGFLQVDSLTIVDVFGQQMTLGTVPLNPVNNTLQTIAALSLQPRSGDTANQDKIFLPPRLLVPTRLWFRWLSALHDNNLSGDFVEMNSHPATSPVCGWVLPNHLDNSLFFYDASGAAVGSFGIEHGVVTYRTRAGNQLNPASDLATDIGPQAGPPTVNPHLATFMWYINGRTAGFLSDLMVAIQNSDAFINPANYSQDANLAVFIGRPLAITRAVLSMETSGGLLPLSQADYSSGDPFPQDVANDRYAYGMRQPFSSANLGGVQFPVRLGELANLDDGLVGYLIESAGSSPGGNPYDTLYSAAAAAGGANGVEQPTPNTIQLTLNTAPLVLTMLVDPRADVHATTGVLPVSQLEIPPDQYSQAMSNLAMTFFTNPVLCGYPAAGDPAQGLVIPLPHESGYSWQWITPGAPGSAMPDPITLKAEAATDFATYSYSPQMLLEGWLKLFPTPPAPPSEEK
jgi:hypothetical protein